MFSITYGVSSFLSFETMTKILFNRKAELTSVYFFNMPKLTFRCLSVIPAPGIVYRNTVNIFILWILCVGCVIFTLRSEVRTNHA